MKATIHFFDPLNSNCFQLPCQRNLECFRLNRTHFLWHFLLILDNQLMHQHDLTDGIVKKGASKMNSDGLFEDNRFRICRFDMRPGPFKLWVKKFLLTSRIFQFRNTTFIFVLLLQLIDPCPCDSYKPGYVVRMVALLKTN